ncbi:uncharacterized protein [Clytia hemisphaerica]|uniref:uncharacterized protein n=1 Tax=Clytia hemisphaerica TaxID=252671 RepID=UPI0034D78D22
MNPLSFSFANFATDCATASQIFSLYWKCVSILEISCNLKVIATVADGASINRRFFQMNRDPDDTSSIVYKVKNQYADSDRYIYFFSDPPHLMKTARNCLWSSGADFSSRLLWNSGDYLLWSHIKSLFFRRLGR